MNIFEKTYICEPIQNKGWLQLIAAWLKYYILTENYDRSLPGRENKYGDWQVDPIFLTQSPFYAREKDIERKDDCQFICHKFNLNTSDILWAKKYSSKMNYNKQVELYNLINNYDDNNN